MQYAASGTPSPRRTSPVVLGANSRRPKRIALEKEFSFDRASMPARTRAFDFVRSVTSVRQSTTWMLLIAKYISMAGWDRSTRLNSSIGNQLFSQMPACEPKRNEPQCNLCKYLRHLLALRSKLGYIFLGCYVRRADVSDSMTRHLVQFRTSPELNSFFPPWDIPYPGRLVRLPSFAQF